MICLRAAARRFCFFVQPVFNQSRAFVSDAKDSTAPYSVLFFGTDSFSLPTLALLASSPNLASNISVMCPQDSPSGRGLKSQPCIVKQFALEHSLPVFRPTAFLNMFCVYLISAGAASCASQKHARYASAAVPFEPGQPLGRGRRGFFRVFYSCSVYLVF
jgi:hypothetical protein